jgi:hypothetical protein
VPVLPVVVVVAAAVFSVVFVVPDLPFFAVVVVAAVVVVFAVVLPVVAAVVVVAVVAGVALPVVPVVVAGVVVAVVFSVFMVTFWGSDFLSVEVVAWPNVAMLEISTSEAEIKRILFILFRF